MLNWFNKSACSSIDLQHKSYITHGCIASLVLDPLVGDFDYIFLISSSYPPCLPLVSSSSPHISFSIIFLHLFLKSASPTPHLITTFSRSFLVNLLVISSSSLPHLLLVSFFPPPNIYLFSSSLPHIFPAQGLWDKQTQRLRDSKTQRLRDFRVGESLGLLVSLRVNYRGNSGFVAVFLKNIISLWIDSR